MPAPLYQSGALRIVPRTARGGNRSAALVLHRRWSAAKIALRVEFRFDSNLLDGLASAGHDINVLDEPYSDTMGHAGAVVLHPNGTCEGAHDPRADGGAAGVWLEQISNPCGDIIKTTGDGMLVDLRVMRRGAVRRRNQTRDG